MAAFPYQAVVFDLDDTLLRDDLTISDYSVSVLRRLAGQGVRIIPASGRAQLSMKPFVERLACASVYISCNGAEIWDGNSHGLLMEEKFSAEMGKKIAAFGKRHQCYMQTYAGDSFFFSEKCVYSERYAASSMLKGVWVGDLEAYIREPRSKILMIDEEPKIAEMLREASLLFRDQVSVTCSKPWFLEFNPLRATKGQALRRAAEFAGFDLRKTIVFGDSMNDLSMLREAGKSVAMANGRSELKSICDAVCASNQEDGVAGFLDQEWERCRID